MTIEEVINGKITTNLNNLIKNMQAHQGNEHKGEAIVLVNIDGKAYPLSGGVSTYGNNVTLFANIEKKG
jgi:hypothetical protein